MAVGDVVRELGAQELTLKLPSYYEIDKSFMSFLLEVFSEEINSLIKSTKDVEKIEDFNFIFGKSLDFYAKDYGEERKNSNDNEFKARITALKIAGNSNGDINTIARGMASYFKNDPTSYDISTIDTRKIEIEYPAELVEKEIADFVNKIKAGGIRVSLSKNKYWEDYTYEELEKFTYKELEKYRYERRK